MINLSNKTFASRKFKYVRIYRGSFCGFIASMLVASPAYSSCISTNFVDYSRTSAFNRPLNATLETIGSRAYSLFFGDEGSSITYYYKSNGAVYKVRTCGYKCNPRLSIVKEFSAKGKCKITKLNNGKFNLNCTAVDKKGEKYTDRLNNTIREKKQYPCD
jgi:hypothetical protein